MVRGYGSRHPREGMKPSVSTEGKPTEKTSAPQPLAHRRHGVLDGIVKGVPRGVYTPMVDGLITGTKCGETGKIHSVAKSATIHSPQEFGAVPFAMSK